MGCQQPLCRRPVGSEHPMARGTILRLLLHTRGRTFHVFCRRRTRSVDTTALREGSTEVGRPLPTLGRRRSSLPRPQPVGSRTYHHPQDVGRRQEVARRRRYRLYWPRGRRYKMAQTQRLLLSDYSRRRRQRRLADRLALKECLWTLRETRSVRARQHSRQRPAPRSFGRHPRRRMVVLSLSEYTRAGTRRPPATCAMERRLATDGCRHRR